MILRPAILILTSCLLPGQAPDLDGGRLDPFWFGPSVFFQPSRDIAFQWIKPGFSLRGRSLRVQDWEAPAWLGAKRTDKDRRFLRKTEGTWESLLELRLRKALAGSAAVSRKEGDLLLVGRSVDAVGSAGEDEVPGVASLSFDLKLVEAATGELLGAIHHTVRGASEEACLSFFSEWCGDLGKWLAEPARRPPAAPLPTPQPLRVFDLRETLQRLETLRKDGILTELEYQALRRKAEEKAKGQ